MKFLLGIGGVASVVMVAAGFNDLVAAHLFGTPTAGALLGLTAGPALVFGLYFFTLQRRIRVLEEEVAKRAKDS